MPGGLPAIGEEVTASALPPIGGEVTNGATEAKGEHPSEAMSMGKAAATTAGVTLAASQVLPRVVPALNTTAEFVAQNPAAQKAIAGAASAAAGRMIGLGSTGTELLAEMYFGSKAGDLVGAGARRLASATQAAKSTVGRNPVTGRFVSKLTPLMESTTLAPSLDIVDPKGLRERAADYVAERKAGHVAPLAKLEDFITEGVRKKLNAMMGTDK